MKELFISSVAQHDKLKGNYKDTLKPKNKQKRSEYLANADDRLIALYNYLVDDGYDVFVYEVLCGESPRLKPIHERRRGYNPPKPKCFGRFAHIWLPEVNIAIRFSNVEYGMKDGKLGQFLHQSRDYCYICVINPSDDPVAKFENISSNILGYKKNGTANKKGVLNTIVIPERKKRARISISTKV